MEFLKHWIKNWLQSSNDIFQQVHFSNAEHNNPCIVNDKTSTVCEDLQLETKHGKVSVNETDNESRHPRATRVHSKIGRVIRNDCLGSDYS